jgi:hypothetical protein
MDMVSRETRLAPHRPTPHSVLRNPPTRALRGELHASPFQCPAQESVVGYRSGDVNQPAPLAGHLWPPAITGYDAER